VGEAKQERREKRRIKEKARMPQHGKSLARVYKNAITKRAKDKEIQKAVP
jgi:hypothetical protein